MVSALFFEGCIKTQTDSFPAPPSFATTETRYEVFTTELETYRIDTINSTSRNLLFTGKYEDAFLGTVGAESYFQFLPSSYTESYPAEGATIVSAQIMLKNDIDPYGELGVGLDSIGFFKLTQDLDGNRSYLSINPATACEANPFVFKMDSIGSKSFILYYNAMPLAQEIFAKWQQLGKFSHDKQFLENWKGFAIKSLGHFKQINRFAFSTTSLPYFMVIKYLKNGSTLTKDFNLKVSSACMQYYRITPGTTGNLWAAIPPEGALPAASTAGKAAIQGGTSLATRVYIPGLKTWKESQTQKIKIFKAELEIVPEFIGSLAPPPVVSMTHVANYHDPIENVENVVFNDEALFLLQQTYTKAAAKTYPSSREFSYNSTTKSYKCNITSHIQGYLDGTIETSHVNVYATDYGLIFNRAIIPQGNVRLKVYYLPLNAK